MKPYATAVLNISSRNIFQIQLTLTSEVTLQMKGMFYVEDTNIPEDVLKTKEARVVNLKRS